MARITSGTGIPVAAYWRLRGEPETPSETLTLPCSEEEMEFFDIMSNPLYGVETRRTSWFKKQTTVPLTSDLAYIRGRDIGTDRFVDILKKAGRSGKEQKLEDWSFMFGKREERK